MNNIDFQSFVANSPVIMGLFNFNRLSYEYISPNIQDVLGYSSENYSKGGIHFSFSIIDPVHANIISGSVFPLCMQCCLNHAKDRKLCDLRFTYEYKITSKSGKPIWCMHQSVIIEASPEGQPVLELFTITDISELKKDDNINLIISKRNNDGIYETIHRSSYPTKDLTILSEREMQILKLMSEGKSTPKIAEILYLSEHTVKSHRKNIMQKMDVKNSIDIIKMALEKGLL